MNAQHRSLSPRKIAERKFPYHVDILVPPFGLGRLLNDMLDWCHENVERGQWDQHAYSKPRGRGVVPKEYARFYFMQAEKSGAFRQRWENGSGQTHSMRNLVRNIESQ